VFASSTQKLGDLAYEQGDTDPARARYAESLDLFRELGDQEGVDDSLIGIAAVLLLEDRNEKAEICR